MFKITLLMALVAFAAAAPLTDDDVSEKPEPVAIIQSESNQDADGSYNFMFEGADGSYRQENAEINEETGIKITGSYKYIDADGDEVLVTYTADENGFVPVGNKISKEISDNAIAAKDLPKYEEPERQARVLEPEVAVKKPAAAIAPKKVEPKVEPKKVEPKVAPAPKKVEPEAEPEKVEPEVESKKEEAAEEPKVEAVQEEV